MNDNPSQDFDEFQDRLDVLAETMQRMTQSLESGGDIERSISKAVNRLERDLRQQLNTTIRETLSSLVTGAGGSSSAASLLTGLLPRFARGGVVDGASVLALGGEAGPEAVLPLRRMPDGRLGVLADTSKKPEKTDVHITIDQRNPDGISIAGDAVGEELAEMIAAAIDDAVDARLAEQIRSGGLLNRIGG